MLNREAMNKVTSSVTSSGADDHRLMRLKSALLDADDGWTDRDTDVTKDIVPSFLKFDRNGT